MATKSCIFCGGRPISEEHVLPEWAGTILTQAWPKPTEQGTQLAGFHRRWGENTDTPVDNSWLGGAPEFTARCVCAPCNTGWMSDIEDAAKPYVAEMMAGRPITLDTEGQRKVAVWLGLKAIVAHYHLPGRLYPEWTADFATNRTPPNAWQIRIARYLGATSMQMANTALGTMIHNPLSPFSVKRPGFLFTVQIQRFVGQVVGIRHQTSVATNRRVFVQIWPHPLIRAHAPSVSDFAPQPWPPERGLNDPDLEKCIDDPKEPRT